MCVPALFPNVPMGYSALGEAEQAGAVVRTRVFSEKAEDSNLRTVLLVAHGALCTDAAWFTNYTNPSAFQEI